MIIVIMMVMIKIILIMMVTLVMMIRKFIFHYKPFSANDFPGQFLSGEHKF